MLGGSIDPVINAKVRALAEAENAPVARVLERLLVKGLEVESKAPRAAV
jgi:hypothetical protein